jgi:hypothetical protein
VSLFAEEIHARIASHFYVVSSDRSVASASELLKKADLERRLRGYSIREQKSGQLGRSNYRTVDLQLNQPVTFSTQGGGVTLTMGNPREHQQADIVVCLR